MQAAVEDDAVTEPVDELQLKGFSRPVAAFRVLELRDER